MLQKSKQIGIFCACTMLMTAWSGITNLASGAEDSNIFTDETMTFEKIHGGVRIVDCAESVATIVIPNEIDGYPIREIGDSAFENCTKLRSVKIKSKMTSIGNGAFSNCVSLKEIEFPETLESIGEAAFYACSDLESLTIPESVSSIGSYAFAYCISLESIELPDKITELPSALFYYDIELNDITLPQKLEHIDSMCIVGCHSIASIEIPSTVTEIEPAAILSCAGLKEINVDANNSVYRSDEKGVLYTADGKTLLLYPANNGVFNYQVPETVKSIGKYAFASSMTLETITFPKSYTEVFPQGAFSDCAKLLSINCNPECLSEISSSLFASCKQLQNLTLPDNCTAIGDYAFFECENLTEMTIPEKVSKIGKSAFCSCNRLTSLTIPDSVTEIGDNAVGYSIETDAENNEQLVQRPDFIIRGRSGSAAKTFAKENGLTFKQTNFDFKWLLIALAVLAGIAAIALNAKRRNAAKKLASAAIEKVKRAPKPEDEYDKNYESILSETAEDENGDPFERSYGFSIDDDLEDMEEDSDETT